MRILEAVDRLYVISLDFKEDRRERLSSQLTELGLADLEDITWIRAVDGSLCQAPKWFTAGPGAWGCLQSHLRVVQDAAMSGIQSYCVLEDDAVFAPRSRKMLRRLMREVPPDWGQIYLGGEHLHETEPLNERPFIWRSSNVNRTHAFMLHRRAFTAFQAHIMNAADYMERGCWHIDHQLGVAHERRDWQVYAPQWWLAGQEAGASNISGHLNPRYWWHHKKFMTQLPFVYVGSSPARHLVEAMRGKVHFGFQLQGETLQHIGLRDCVHDPCKLRECLELIATEALSLGMVPGVQHQEISKNQVSKLWQGLVLAAEDSDFDDLLDYPFNGYFPHILNLRRPPVAFAVA